MDDWGRIAPQENAADEAQSGQARIDAAAGAAAIKEFLDERGTRVDIRGLSDQELDLIRRTIIDYANALRTLQESPDSVIEKVKRLMQEGTTPELAGARRRLVNEAVTWALKAYYDADRRPH